MHLAAWIAAAAAARMLHAAKGVAADVECVTVTWMCLLKCLCWLYLGALLTTQTSTCACCCVWPGGGCCNPVGAPQPGGLHPAAAPAAALLRPLLAAAGSAGEAAGLPRGHQRVSHTHSQPGAAGSCANHTALCKQSASRGVRAVVPRGTTQAVEQDAGDLAAGHSA